MKWNHFMAVAVAALLASAAAAANVFHAGFEKSQHDRVIILRADHAPHCKNADGCRHGDTVSSAVAIRTSRG